MAVVKQTDARRKAVQRFDAIKVDKATIRLPKGTKEAVKAHGHSLNSYVVEAVIEKMERDNITIKNS